MQSSCQYGARIPSVAWGQDESFLGADLKLTRQCRNLKINKIIACFPGRYFTYTDCQTKVAACVSQQ